MHLRRIKVHDWKCYGGVAELHFPTPEPGRNIVLVGAENGFGKTSLFEAIVLGMFGRDGLPLLGRARFGISGGNPLDETYTSFMAGVLHKPAQAAGRTRCSVELEFEDGGGQPLVVQRTWHFSPSGTLKRYDEEVTAYEGRERRPIGPPPGGGIAPERLDWFRDWVAKTFVPYYLGWFFLFDGEMVQTFARHDMRAQVRNGIEGLLGLPVLRDLASDLRAYASARGQGAGPQADTVARVEAERDGLENRATALAEESDGLAAQVAALEERRDALVRELHGHGSGTQASLQELFQRREQRRADLRTALDRLDEAVESDLALALCGPVLRSGARERLRREARREQWEAGRAHGDARLEVYVEAVERSLALVEPPLAVPQVAAVLARIREAWDRLWNPPDPDTAESYRHPYLVGAERGEAVARLARVAAGGEGLLRRLAEIAAHEADIARLDEEVHRIEGVGPELDAKKEELREANARLGPLQQRLGAARNERTAVEAQASAKRAEVAKLRQAASSAAPGLRRAAAAERVAAALDEIVSLAVPTQVGAVAEAMSEAYRSLSHKGLVDRVSISAEGEPRLLTRAGQDITDLDGSAGERQLFSLALIAAVLRVSGRRFPMVVDTPLARLDGEHRGALLRRFAEQPGQVILLSTNTEVVGDALAAIRRHVGKAYRLRHAHDGRGLGSTRVEEGYFEETAG